MWYHTESRERQPNRLNRTVVLLNDEVAYTVHGDIKVHAYLFTWVGSPNTQRTMHECEECSVQQVSHETFLAQICRNGTALIQTHHKVWESYRGQVKGKY